MTLGAYRQLLRPPGTARVVVSVLVGRLPVGIFSLAIVLLIRQQTGSFAQAGAVSAAWAIGMGAVAPVQGVLVDRFGQPAVLLPSTVANALASGGLVVAARGGASSWVLCALAVVGGAGIPPLGACMRSVWAAVFAGDASARNAAYTYEGVIGEAFYVVGPVVTTVLVAVSSPSVAVLAAVFLSMSGTIGFATAMLSRRWRGEIGSRPRAGALVSPGLRILTLSILPTGVAFGALEVAMPAFASAHGERAAFSGVLLAAMALGSVAGGIAYGARRWTGPLGRRFIALQMAFTIGLLPLLLADSIASMVVLMIFAGLALAPSAASAYMLIDRLSPLGTGTEATTWIMTANVAGGAIGAAVGGALVQHASVRWAIALACLGPAIGTLVCVLGRRRLAATATAAAAAVVAEHADPAEPGGEPAPESAGLSSRRP